MKRIGLIAGGTAILILALAAMAPWVMPEREVRNAVLGELEALTGRTAQVEGAARLDLLPFPSVTVERLTIPAADGKTPLLQVGRLEGTLSLPALLVGRIEMSSVALHHPWLNLQADGDGYRSWAFSKGVLADAAQGHPVPRQPLTSIRFINGTLVYADQRSGRAATLDLQDAALSWAKVGDGVSGSGIVGWRGQTMDVAVTLSDPASLLAGARSNVRGRIACDLFKLNAAGALAGDGRFEGKIAGAADSLRDMIRWVGFDVGEGPSLRKFKLQSPAVIEGRGMAFSAVQVELDGNSAEGALTLKLDGPRPKLTGTLAAETLDITPYVDEVEVVEGPMRRWRNDPITFETLALGDLDLRISSGETVFGNARLGRTAAAAVARNGAFELSVGEVSAYGGTLNGRLTFVKAADGPNVKASVDFDAVDMAHALGDLFAFRKLEGTGRGSFDLAATGDSVDELLHTLTGQASVNVSSGALVGIDLVGVMRRIERRPLSIGYEPRTGRTAFDRATASFAVTDGIARTSDARLEGPVLSVTVDGKTGVAARDFDLAGEATLAAQQEASEPFRLPFKILGDWDWPTVEPDPDALIRRSGAAAPLLQHEGRAFTAEGAAKPAAAPPPPATRTLTP